MITNLPPVHRAAPKADRVFVPLSTDPYRWFESGEKKWELRGVGGAFTEKHLRVGRRVELRRGYSTPDSLWGTIAEVKTAKTVEQLYDQVPFQVVVPVAGSQAEATEMAHDILGPKDGYIAFRVELD